jgi:isoleucyl-tRNA synthetase
VRVLVTEGSPEAAVLMKYEAAMAEFLNVSQANVQAVAASTGASAIVIEAAVAEGNKCGRCWRVVPDVGVDDRWPVVCARCATALDAIGFEPMVGEA